MAVQVEDFVLLYDRPDEPLVSSKGDNNTVYQLYKQLIADDEMYKEIGLEVNQRYIAQAKRVISLEVLPQLPPFKKARKLPKNAAFSILIPAHQEMADEVIEALLAVPENNLPHLLVLLVYIRVRLNAQLSNYVQSVILLHRSDTKHITIQNYAKSFPGKFVDSHIYSQALENSSLYSRGVPRNPIAMPINYTASGQEVEQRLAYFREDIGLNLNNWNWHLVYPFSSNHHAIVNKRRRGEIFYYMHQQIIARYNGERLANSLGRVKQFNNFYEAIPEAYFSKLDSYITARGCPARQANMQWLDVNRPKDGLHVTLDDMNRWRRHIIDAIATGQVKLPDDVTQELTIEILGNMIEANVLSPNKELYGSIHSMGLNLAGFMHDPKSLYLEPFGVIADEATTMRDPFYYRWHAFIDDLFQRFKQSPYVKPYTREELENPGVEVSSVRVESFTGDVNTMNTYWMHSDLDMSRGLNFAQRGAVYVRFTHLNHRPFKYVIDANNNGKEKKATVRIFMAPKYDERSLTWIIPEEYPLVWKLADQRKMFIEMDKFVVTLKSGNNTITRESKQSSITIPFDQTFHDMIPSNIDPGKPNIASTMFTYGWPQHLLVPRGTEGGMKYDLFVMLSDFEVDTGKHPGSEVTDRTYFGLGDQRSMGYPFDRTPSNRDILLKDFLLPNMAATDVTIRLQNVTEHNPETY